MGDMGYKEAAVQGVYGEALDTMMQEVRDGAESMAVLDVLERMCRKEQLRTAQRAWRCLMSWSVCAARSSSGRRRVSGGSILQVSASRISSPSWGGLTATRP